MYLISENGEKGLVNQRDEVVIEPQFINCFRLANSDYWYVQWENRIVPEGSDLPEIVWGLVNPIGEVIYRSERMHGGIAQVDEGTFVVAFEDGAIEYVGGEPDGFRLPPDATDLRGPVRDGMLMVTNGEKWGYSNSNGELVFPYQFDSAVEVSDGTACARKGDLLQVISADGTVIGEVSDREYSPQFAFSDGLAVVRDQSSEHQRFRYINQDGEDVFSRSFVVAYPFEQGRAVVLDQETLLYGLIDLEGEWVFEPKYKVLVNAGEQSEPIRFPFKEGNALREPVRGGYLDRDGNEVIVFENLLSLDHFHNGAAMIETTEYHGLIDINGEWIWREPASSR